MRAAVLHELGATPTVQEFGEPTPKDAAVVVNVSAGGLNPADLVIAAGIQKPPPFPYVPGSEGVGNLADGTRVYFSNSVAPFGSLAERCLANDELIVPMPSELSDGAAIAVGTAGTSAWIPLTQKAHLQPGESVLVLGATGSVGQIAVQAAKVLGAARVVAAGRNRPMLEKLRDRGADDIVVLEDGYEDALIAASNGGFDLVIDMLYGAPMAAGIKATRAGGRIVNVGMRAGRTVELSGLVLKGRDLLTYGGERPSLDIRRDAISQLWHHVITGDITVEFESLPLEDVAEAWKRQGESPNTKLVLTP